MPRAKRICARSGCPDLGTGIGSALVVNGQIVPNSEFGHLELDGVDAETRASAVARERDRLDWREFSARLQRYFPIWCSFYHPI